MPTVIMDHPPGSKKTTWVFTLLQPEFDQAAGWLLNANQRVRWLVLPVFGLPASFARSACQASYSGVPRRGGACGGNPPIQCGMSTIWGPLALAETNEQSAHSVKKVRSTKRLRYKYPHLIIY